MKKLIYILVCIALILGNRLSHAQTVINAELNDSLIIDVEGYKQGEIQWQLNTAGGNSWRNISSAKNKETLRYKVTAPALFRSQINDGTCEPIISDTIKANMYQTYNVKGGQGYIESSPNVGVNDGIKMTEKGSLSSWTNTTSRKPVWFLLQKPGTYMVSFNISGATNRNYEFEMKTSTTQEEIEFKEQIFPFTFTSKGGAEVIPTFTVTIPKEGNYRYELTAKSSMTGLTINDLQFKSIRAVGEPTTNTSAAARLNATSLHLSFSSTAATKKEYDWLYQEIMVPEGYAPRITYWMSLGFFCGYMGMQANSDTERRILFSTWDALDKDKNPNLPEDVLTSLVDKGKNVQANAFGNEGTGGQSYVKGNENLWKTERPVKFLMNARRDGERIYHGSDLYNSNGSVAVKDGDKIKQIIISAWYDVGDGEGWKYIASWRAKRLSNSQDMFDGFYSFIENFDRWNGEVNRKGYYYNAFARELSSNKWVNLNKVTFSTDGNARKDYGHGIDNIHPDKFYMQTGGYGKNTTVGSSATLPILDPDQTAAIQGLNIGEFTSRVDVALEREEYLKNLEYLDKTGWSLASFSSEHPNENGGVYGAARFIIDGNDASYWHSKYSGSGSSYPHWFVIDMAKEQNIRGFRLVPSGGSNRYPKEIKLEVSNSKDGGWIEVWLGNAIFSPELIELDTTAKGYRYFKLTINSGTATDGVHTRLAEIYVF